MTDAAIKAALEAAGEAVRQAIIKPPCCMEGTGCELPPCHCSSVAAAGAIAAFLRALPPGSRADCHPIRMHATQLADEVERAAGGGDG